MQRVTAACKWVGPGGAVSHRSAGRIWKICSVPDDDPIELSSPRDLRCQPNVLVHEIDSWARGDVCRRKHLLVTTPTRTVIDLASILSAEQLRVAVEEAVVAELLDLRRLERRLNLAGRRGRSGVGKLAELIGEFNGTSLLPQSVLERRYLRAAMKASLPPAELQYRVSAAESVYFIDFAYPHNMLAVEMDGWRFHGTRRRWEADIQRSNDLVTLGWRVVRGT